MKKLYLIFIALVMGSFTVVRPAAGAGSSSSPQVFFGLTPAPSTPRDLPQRAMAVLSLHGVRELSAEHCGRIASFVAEHCAHGQLNIIYLCNIDPETHHMPTSYQQILTLIACHGPLMLKGYESVRTTFYSFLPKLSVTPLSDNDRHISFQMTMLPSVACNAETTLIHHEKQQLEATLAAMLGTSNGRHFLQAISDYKMDMNYNKLIITTQPLETFHSLFTSPHTSLFTSPQPSQSDATNDNAADTVRYRLCGVTPCLTNPHALRDATPVQKALFELCSSFLPAHPSATFAHCSDGAVETPEHTTIPAPTMSSMDSAAAGTSRSEYTSAPETASTARPSRSCSTCGKPARQRCAACKVEWYCSTGCQKESWPAHKKVCTKPTQCSS